ncbi:M15 family metallopeptidase [Chitinophaga caeni]|uniref:M15 family metallopeptidase n=1 Tax=Chitinophaga caeni TaxID=2029983 RepID=UPI0012FD491F|nr:M15 family metallopeptidase [Chitinophaga caeni]
MKKIPILCLFLICRYAFAQHIPKNQYGLEVINTMELYQQSVQIDSNQLMVPLKDWLRGLHYDIRYATRHNFTGSKLYDTAFVLVRLPVAKALKAVNDSLQKMGYCLLIFDGYRPYSVTEKMWKIVPDDRYAADPKKGSGHNRGAAIDLSIYDLNHHHPLKMPTDFDDFTDLAHHDYIITDPEVRKNRALLKSLMEWQGFKALSTEWWHYYLPDYKKYPLMDVDFESLIEGK